VRTRQGLLPAGTWFVFSSVPPVLTDTVVNCDRWSMVASTVPFSEGEHTLILVDVKARLRDRKLNRQQCTNPSCLWPNVLAKLLGCIICGKR